MVIRLRPCLSVCNCLLGLLVALYMGPFAHGHLLEAAAPGRLQRLSSGGKKRQKSNVRSLSGLLLMDGRDQVQAAGGEQAATQPGSKTLATTASGILAPLLRERRPVKVDGYDRDTILLYFAFGANMCPSVFTSKRGVKPLASLPAEALRFTTGTRKTRNKIGDGVRGRGLSDDSSREVEGEVCLCFCHRAGYATLVQKPGPPQPWKTSPGVHGVLHAISSGDLNNIAASENGYRKRLVEVVTPTGDEDVAVCFVSNPSQTLPTSVPPTSRYLSLLLEGAVYHDVNESYRSWLAGLPSVPPENETTSPERVNTPSKRALDAILAVMVVAAFGAAGVAVNPF